MKIIFLCLNVMKNIFKKSKNKWEKNPLKKVRVCSLFSRNKKIKK